MEYCCYVDLDIDCFDNAQRYVKVSFIVLPLKTFCDFKIYRYNAVVQGTLAVTLMHCHAYVEYTASCKLTGENFHYTNIYTT
jgi:hypothetical protein